MTGYEAIKNYPLLKGVALEVGSESKESSTTFLYRYCKSHGMEFVTVDCEPKVYERAKSICGDQAHLGKGEEFVERLSNICYVYMDCFDYHGDEPGDVPEAHHERYRLYGYPECSGGLSVQVHLEIAKKVEKRTADKCLIVFDDTNFRPYAVTGKGAFAVPYLIGCGFKVVDFYEHEAFSLEAYTVLYREK